MSLKAFNTVNLSKFTKDLFRLNNPPLFYLDLTYFQTEECEDSLLVERVISFAKDKILHLHIVEKSGELKRVESKHDFPSLPVFKAELYLEAVAQKILLDNNLPIEIPLMYKDFLRQEKLTLQRDYSLSISLKSVGELIALKETYKRATNPQNSQTLSF